MTRTNLFILVLIALVNLLAWSLGHDNHAMPEAMAINQVRGLAYSPFRPGQSPITGVYPTPQQIDQDMQLLEGKTVSVSTYGATKGLEAIPALALKHHIHVTVCAWIDDDLANNEREIQSVIALANTYPNVDAVLVGNEAVLRADHDPDRTRSDRVVARVIDYMARVRAQVRVPVSCAETYDVLVRHPDLARECDFLSAHILPYWEGVPIEAAVNEVLGKFTYLQSRFPGKRIVISEAGWPSAGDYEFASVPSRWNQECFVRQFLAEANGKHIEYFLCEAFDQPWKSAEGGVGRYWGLWDAQRQSKFAWEEPTPAGPPWTWAWALSTILGMSLVGWFANRRTDLNPEGRLFFGFILQACISLLIYTGVAPTMAWLTPGAKMAWLVLFPTQVFMLIVVAIQGLEMADLIWLKRWSRRFSPYSTPDSRARRPKVSIHVPCCNEPPALVIRLLESLAGLDYPDYEVLVIDNNTKDPQLWHPLRDWCMARPGRFRFFHLEKWPGFKAGALNFALDQTATDAEIVGIVDADYIVKPNWLAALSPYFEDREVGFVQCPQDHRAWDRCAFKEMCNWEYAGFFQIGMIHRNEHDAIIQHGTMVLIRREAMDRAGGWGQWCIVEDAELGLRLMSMGYRSVYIPQSFGRGVVPDSFQAYKNQRFRWVYGAVQILRKHGRELLPGSDSRLSAAQKYHFIAGWLPWFGDALHLLFTLLLIGWTAGMIFLPHWFMAPAALFIAPPILVGVFNVVRSIWLYRARVDCTAAQRVGACVAGMGLTYTIGKACITGLLTTGRPFLRTPKCEHRCSLIKALAMARDEFLLLALLWAGIAGIVTYRYCGIPQMKWWIAGMAFQSTPYAAAVFCSLVSGMPALNSVTRRFGERRATILARRAQKARRPQPNLAMSKAGGVVG